MHGWLLPRRPVLCASAYAATSKVIALQAIRRRQAADMRTNLRLGTRRREPTQRQI